MSNFLTRAITGAVFVILMVGGILWNTWSFVGLFSLISLLCIWEFFSLTEPKANRIQKLTGMMMAAILIAASFGKHFLQINSIQLSNHMQVIILFFPAFLIFQLFRRKPQLTIFSPTLFGILYAVLPFCYLQLYFEPVSWHNSQGNAKVILGFFLLIWSNDTFAYLVGMSMGRTKLFERISPKKTWEGTIGGMICTQGIAYLLSLYFTELAMVHWLVVGLIVSVFGTLGDLVESMLKRNYGVKDSGNILPGHGGILDRFDGVLLAAPIVVSYLMWVH